jgi:hypothetical protein
MKNFYAHLSDANFAYEFDALSIKVHPNMHLKGEEKKVATTKAND